MLISHSFVSCRFSFVFKWYGANANRMVFVSPRIKLILIQTPLFRYKIQLTNKLSMCERRVRINSVYTYFSLHKMRKSCLAHYVNNVIMPLSSEHCAVAFSTCLRTKLMSHTLFHLLLLVAAL